MSESSISSESRSALPPPGGRGPGARRLAALWSALVLAVVACSPSARGPGEGTISRAGASGSAASAGVPDEPPDHTGEAGAESAGGGSSAGGSSSNPDPVDTAGAGGGDAPPSPPPGTLACRDVIAEPLPARLAITSAQGGPAAPPPEETLTITKQALFREFERQGCGSSGCHGGGDAPLAVSPQAFKVRLGSFDQRPDLGSASMERVLSSDPFKVMPPGSGDGSKRGPDDPLRQLAERLLAWEEAGFPPSFEIRVEAEPVDPGEELPGEPYQLSPALGAKLTNLGSCVPSVAMLSQVPDDVSEEMRKKDALFASINSSEGLPDTLSETDLVSLDAAVLARRRVFSYAPTYTLFSDNAGKMRHVRVPAGKVVRYNDATNDFDIPDNTRFYKTFLKQVTDKDGQVGYRKMETRIIVVRQDEPLEGGGYRTRALRAAYAWDKDERVARRVKDPLRNGQPAADRLCAYVVNETLTRDPEKNPVSDELSEHCTYMTEEELANPSSGQIRHYAIPSTQRCDQCHMGANNHSYILGFNPWQVDRRPDGEGGVYEPPTEDELTQLTRLTEYGVVSGLKPGQAKLEESQGERTPRNEYELKAQAYMMGNCVFCHSGHGFPVVQNELLKEFDLYPSETGGVFQFDLERYSPRAKAGSAQSVRFPYITPTFGDVMAEGANKVLPDRYPPPVLDAAPDFDVNTFDFTFLGPWRSLIWRNVYTPFTYDEDNTIFVHMPRNVPGYDCRAQKIMAEWMLSIPSGPKVVASTVQPVREIRIEEVEYEAAVHEANRRLLDFNKSITGAHCPEDDDIVDPKVVLSKRDFATNRKLRAAPKDDGTFNNPRLIPDLPYLLPDQVPDHAHWVPTDTTDAPGKWVPRRPNWAAVIASREVAPTDPKLSRVIDDLQSVNLSAEQREFSLDPVPLGLWHEACQGSPEVADSPRVADMVASPTAPLTRWLRGTVMTGEEALSGEPRVHLQSRGAAVFQAICQNCHGKAADSQSPLAATLLELTGGRTRVANFVDGLFGPVSAPGAYARGEFLVDRGATPEEWLARYVLFMGLGGTEAELPAVILNLVASSPFYGQTINSGVIGGDPNMLLSALIQCENVLKSSRELPRPTGAGPPTPGQTVALGPLIPKGGGLFTYSSHYELWESLCSFGNEPVVQVFDARPGGGEPIAQTDRSYYRARDGAGDLLYPSDHPVGTARGVIESGIQASNTLPWCLRAEDPQQRTAVLDWASKSGIPPERTPLCPPALFARAFDKEVHLLALGSYGGKEPVAFGNHDFIERWVRRGAFNAGIAAFHYLRAFTSGEIEPTPEFDFCKE